MSDEDYGDEDDFDDYEFEDFEDSETDSVDLTEKNINLTQRDSDDTAGIDTIKGKGEVSPNENQEDLDSTKEHNQQVIANLKLNEISVITQTEDNSSGGVDNSINCTNISTNDENKNNHSTTKKDIGANTLVHSISTELRQMMQDEALERQDKENVRIGGPVLRGPATKRKGASGTKHQYKHKNYKNKNKNHDFENNKVRSPVSMSTLLPGEEGLTDNSSSLVEGGTYLNNTSSIATQDTSSPSKVFTGPGSEAWKSQLDSYSHAQEKCVANEKKRTAQGSRFIQSQVSQDSKLHRSTVERQLAGALQQVNSYRKENLYLTKMIDTSCIHAEFNVLRVQNEEQHAIIKQLTEEKRSLLLVQRNQEKSLLETEKEKESLPEQEHINQKKMIVFQKKVKTLRDNLYHYQVKTREEMNKNKLLTEHNTKLKVKLKALMITHSVAEQLKRDQLGLTVTDDQDQDASQSVQLKFDSLGVGDEATANKQDSTVVDKEETLEEIRIQRNKLKSIVENQRASFRNQLLVSTQAERA